MKSLQGTLQSGNAPRVKVALGCFDLSFFHSFMMHIAGATGARQVFPSRTRSPHRRQFKQYDSALWYCREDEFLLFRSCKVLGGVGECGRDCAIQHDHRSNWNSWKSSRIGLGCALVKLKLIHDFHDLDSSTRTGISVVSCSSPIGGVLRFDTQAPASNKFL